MAAAVLPGPVAEKMASSQDLYFCEVFLVLVFLLIRKSFAFPVSRSTPISESTRRARLRGIPNRLAVSASERGLKSSFVRRIMNSYPYDLL